MNAIVYAPSLSYRISSQVEIGIEKQGRYEKLITNERESSTTNSGSQQNTNSTIISSDTSKVRKKTTNPKKRASRPKASGLLGGVVRAVGGDYSGLVQWGGGFLDHMMEPRYNWDVTETYSTSKNTKTTTSQSITNSWKNTSRLSEVITNELKYDINKGFIQFTVSLTNVGERTIHINRPNFFIHFVHEDGSEVFAGSAKVLSGLESGGTISPNQNYLLQVRAENLDFIDLSDKYRRADGIRIALQDLKVRFGDEQMAVSEVREQLQDTHVQFDYYDGNRRSTRYLAVQPGVTLQEFLTLALKNKNYQLGADGSEALVREINGLTSSTAIFAELRAERDRFEWRRWFTSVVDDNGRVFEANRDSKLYPGYSVKLGYFGAKDILPESEYRPVVYRKTNVPLDTEQLYQLELDLAPGDIIEFTNLRFGNNFYLNKVDFDLLPASQQEVLNWQQQQAVAQRWGATSGGITFSGYGGPAGLSSFDSLVQRIRKGEPGSFAPAFGPANPSAGFYKLTPTRVQRVPARPQSLILNQDDSFNLSKEEALLLLRALQCMGLGKRFVHYRNSEAAGDLNFQHATISYNAPSGTQVTLKEMMARLGMLRRHNESDEDFLRRWLREEQVLQFEVTETVRKPDNFWRFAAPEAQIPSGFIQLQKAVQNPAQNQHGYLFSDGATLGPLEIRPPLPFGFAAMPFAMPQADHDPRKYLYLPDIDSPLMVLASQDPALPLPRKVGSEITATLQVVRYND
ncbi:hypothetical protein [Microbulbifer aestuariivivens]